MRHRHVILSAVCAVAATTVALLVPQPRARTEASVESLDIRSHSSPTPDTAARIPVSLTLVALAAGQQDSTPPRRWTRVEPRERAGSGAPESTEAYRAWEIGYLMKEPADFPDVPAAIRGDLAGVGCRIPQWTGSAEAGSRTNVLWAEVERRGQRDLIVLCAVGRSANAYVFWNGDVMRREVLPFAGAGATLTIPTHEAIEGHANPRAVVTADMPQTLEHDAIAVSCCECCSVYYYRHNGAWFSAPGAD